MSLFSSFAISGSALTAEKLRLDTIAGNMSNLNTTRSPGGGPYQRRTVVFAEQLEEARDRIVQSRGRGRTVRKPEKPIEPGMGVRVHAIYKDHRPARLVFDPDHPDADPETGYVAYPNIEVAKEVTDLITTQRSYEANSTVFKTTKEIYQKALEIGR